MEELLRLCREYADRFGDAFPTFEIVLNMSEEEGLALIRRCLSENKSVEELGLYKVKPGRKY